MLAYLACDTCVVRQSVRARTGFYNPTQPRPTSFLISSVSLLPSPPSSSAAAALALIRKFAEREKDQKVLAHFLLRNNLAAAARAHKLESWDSLFANRLRSPEDMNSITKLRGCPSRSEVVGTIEPSNWHGGSQRRSGFKLWEIEYSYSGLECCAT